MGVFKLKAKKSLNVKREQSSDLNQEENMDLGLGNSWTWQLEREKTRVIQKGQDHKAITVIVIVIIIANEK